MPQKITIAGLKESLGTILEAALIFYMMKTGDDTDSAGAKHAWLQVYEIEAGLSVVDLLVGDDGVSFAGPGSMAAVRETLVTFFHELGLGCFPMIKRRTADLLDRIDVATASTEAVA